ncbi:hypothetical protein ACTOB_003676 [Actinoplanes oblitus]|uniref:Uncharacterized protein n=1 Tax=Actinoplanes oblitus TaxID=3040509 RepID=A0ABY8WT87_9ACTN|nr:hypothetical protein [Actinoplanes oblitus]WIN00003.1 hypothetical protein ACTOB_003676 [Actinoplanes oblitus]
MASKATNEQVERLARRHAAEKSALVGALGAAEAVKQAQAVVASAEAELDLALATLAALMPSDSAAELAEVGAARVVQAVRRAPVEAVTGRVAELTGSVPAKPRRGRPPGSGMSHPANRGGGAPERGDSGVSVGSSAAGVPAAAGAFSGERPG